MNDLEQVKQLAAILYQQEEELKAAIPLLESTFSGIDFSGDFFPFIETDYYEEEMGAELKRGIISFEKLVHPGELAGSKLAAKGIEDGFRQQGNRQVNIDIGYMDMFKVVLASFKGRSNKIYLSDGIWADPILFFEQGEYKTFNWGFPDFKSGIYNADFKKIRSLYKQQLKALRST